MNGKSIASEITGQTRLIAVAGHLSAEMAGEAVLLHKSNGRYYGLNRIGKRIWDLLQLETSSDELVAVVTSEYHAEPSVVRRDVDQLVAELLDAGLVRLARAD